MMADYLGGIPDNRGIILDILGHDRPETHKNFFAISDLVSSDHAETKEGKTADLAQTS